MEISIKKSYGFSIIFKAENVNVCEDIEERIYGKTEDGKTDYENVKRDVKTDVIEQFVSVLDDIINYRKSAFDSSYLIESLFEKLPKNIASSLLVKLNCDYENEFQIN